MCSLKKKDMLIVIFDVLWFNQRNIVHKSLENHGPIQVANIVLCKPAIWKRNKCRKPFAPGPTPTHYCINFCVPFISFFHKRIQLYTSIWDQGWANKTYHVNRSVTRIRRHELSPCSSTSDVRVVHCKGCQTFRKCTWPKPWQKSNWLLLQSIPTIGIPASDVAGRMPNYPKS